MRLSCSQLSTLSSLTERPIALIALMIFFGLSPHVGFAATDTTGSPSAPANVAPPISTIATFEGEYLCIYHDRIYSVGAEICVGKQALKCETGQFGSGKRPAVAAKWVDLATGDLCAASISPSGPP